jgi:hypothetical protein
MLRVFHNRVFTRTFGPQRVEVVGCWRRLHNEELHNLYASPNVIRVIKLRRIRAAQNAARVGEMRNAYKILVGKPDGTRPRKRPRRGWKDNIRMDLTERAWKDVDWIHVAQIEASGRIL